MTRARRSGERTDPRPSPTWRWVLDARSPPLHSLIARADNFAGWNWQNVHLQACSQPEPEAIDGQSRRHSMVTGSGSGMNVNDAGLFLDLLERSDHLRLDIRGSSDHRPDRGSPIGVPRHEICQKGNARL